MALTNVGGSCGCKDSLMQDLTHALQCLITMSTIVEADKAELREELTARVQQQ